MQILWFISVTMVLSWLITIQWYNGFNRLVNIFQSTVDMCQQIHLISDIAKLAINQAP